MSTAYAEARRGGYEIVHPLTEEELPGIKTPRDTEILGEDFGYTGSVDQVRSLTPPQSTSTLTRMPGRPP